GREGLTRVPARDFPTAAPAAVRRRARRAPATLGRHDRKDATMACLDLPGIAQHVVQCGPGRTGRFDSDDDRAGYLRELAAAAHAEYCHLHAYALLDRHAHLLLTPVAPGQAIRMMRALERRLARPFAWRCHS